MPRRKEQRKRVRTIRHFAAVDRLDPRFHDELHAMRVAGKVRQIHIIDWLAARGCTLSKGAMCRYRKAFLAARERRRVELRDAERAAEQHVSELVNCAHIAANPPPHQYTAASLLLCEQLLFASLGLLGSATDPDFDMELFVRYGDALTAVVETRRQYTKRGPGAIRRKPGPLERFA